MCKHWLHPVPDNFLSFVSSVDVDIGPLVVPGPRRLRRFLVPSSPPPPSPLRSFLIRPPVQRARSLYSTFLFSCPYKAHILTSRTHRISSFGCLSVACRLCVLLLLLRAVSLFDSDARFRTYTHSSHMLFPPDSLYIYKTDTRNKTFMFDARAKPECWL